MSKSDRCQAREKPKFTKVDDVLFSSQIRLKEIIKHGLIGWYSPVFNVISLLLSNYSKATGTSE